MSADQAMREYGASLPVPEFDTTPWTVPPPLEEATVAIVTSAAVHTAADDRFDRGDASFRIVERDRRDLVLGHWSPNFDQSGFRLDLNVVFPIDRLEEMAEEGLIGAVAPRHLSFAGNQPDDVATVRLDSGPAAARELRNDGVDVVIFTPV